MHLDVQTLITAALVTACGSYASWTVMPRAWQQRLAAWIGRPLPAASGCGGGCEGCGSARPEPGAKPGTPGVAVIQIVRRPPVR